MDESSEEVYDYDKCLFFRLLERLEYRIKFEFIQRHQGLIVCPLKLHKFNKSKRKDINHLIDSHLFLPSPFYKNHYIPLTSLIALSSLNSSNVFNTSLPLDHTQQIHLILNNNDNTNNKNNELFLMNFSRPICRNVKVLGSQTAFTDNFRKYKILIINKQLNFNRISNWRPLTHKKIIKNVEKLVQVNSETDYDDDHDDDLKSINSDNELSETDTTHQRLQFINQLTSNEFDQSPFTSLNDIKTYRQSIDFMQENILVSTFNNSDTTSSSSGDENKYDKYYKNKSLIGASLLSELELFRKTYIILHTHLDDCIEQLTKKYTKYLKKFINALKRKNFLNNDSIYLMILLSCENTIIGFLYTKLWPCILKLNYEEDSSTELKCKQLGNYLKLNSNKLNSESAQLCSRFFNIDSKYFHLNTQPVLNELKRLSLLNIPYEKLECLKSTIDLLTNELTILMASKKEQCIITSDLLVPLVAFILIKLNINCLHSIIYFVDKFQLSAKQNVKVVSSTKLDELCYLMTTLKAAVQFIQTSQII